MVNTALQQQVLAVVLGLADDADAPVTDEVALVRLVAFGDVLRAFAGNTPFPTPSTLRVWLKQCDAAVLARAVAMHTAEFATLATQRDDEALAFSLLVRDQARSINAALDWRNVVIFNGLALNIALENLDDAAMRYDSALRKNGVGPRMIATMLGDRARLPQ